MEFKAIEIDWRDIGETSGWVSKANALQELEVDQVLNLKFSTRDSHTRESNIRDWIEDDVRVQFMDYFEVMNDKGNWEGGVFRCSGFSLFFFYRRRVCIFLILGDLLGLDLGRSETRGTMPHEATPSRFHHVIPTTPVHGRAILIQGRRVMKALPRQTPHSKYCHSMVEKLLKAAAKATADNVIHTIENQNL